MRLWRASRRLRCLFNSAKSGGESAEQTRLPWIREPVIFRMPLDRDAESPVLPLYALDDSVFLVEGRSSQVSAKFQNGLMMAGIHLQAALPVEDTAQ